MEKYLPKIIAPIIIVVLVGVYYIVMGLFIGSLPLPLWGRFIAIAVPLAIVGVCIYVLIQRINEIRSGEEDDLSKY